ncbi:MAG: hypothetical protein IKT73_01990 [Anaerotignum sp.]|nr:hypothetical protein [Anaerotignum sp.]
MAQIRMNAGEIDFLCMQCKMLADKYADNIGETNKILQLIDNAWDGDEIGGHVEQLKESLHQTEIAKQMLLELAYQLENVSRSMRDAEQHLASQLRGIFD